MLAENAGVDGHVIHALFGLLFDDLEHEIEGEIFGAANARNGFVNGDGADGNGRRVNDGFADGGNVATRRKVHDGVRPVMDRVVKLFQFFVDVGGGGGVADVRVDFALESDADAHRLEVAVMNVGRDDGAAAGDFAAYEFRLDLFAFGDVGHFFGDDAFAGEVHLGHVSRAVDVGLVGFAFFDPGVTEWHKSPKRS